MTVPATAPDLQAELDRQVQRLVDRDVPAAAGLSEPAFRDLLAPLAAALPDPAPAGDGELPLVVVLPRGLVPPLALVERLELRGRAGFSSMAADELAAFVPSPDVAVPDGPYLLVDVDPGEGTRGLSPDAALPGLLAAGRSPLTLEEGLAVVLQDPEVLRRRTGFELLGSRAADRRVTGLWVMKGGAPRLGWCWWGAPHSWLGMASCAGRHAPAPRAGRTGRALRSAHQPRPQEDT